jgi:hypothetical protein
MAPSTERANTCKLSNLAPIEAVSAWRGSAHNECIGGLEIQQAMRAADELRKTKLNSYLTVKAGRHKKRPAFVFMAVRQPANSPTPRQSQPSTLK